MKQPYFLSLNKGHYIAFFPDTCRFFRTNQNGKDLIKAISVGTRFEEVGEVFGLPQNKVLEYSANIEAYATQRIISEPLGTEKNQSETHLDRLVIHVANDCNLRCLYCYASGGAYGSKRELMPLDLLKSVLDVFFEKFTTIANIQIFGGEPLLNMPAVKYICEYINHRYIRMGHETRIALVTNATLIDSEFIDLVKKHNINVTISYDGDVATNDALRIYPDRHGSSDDILQKTKELYDATGQPNTIEVTYTQFHVNNNVRIMDIVRNIKTMFPKTGVHLVPVSGCEGSPVGLKSLEMFPDSVDELFAEKNLPEAPTYSLVERIFAGMSNPNPYNRFICSAGVGTLSVSAEGDVYPCFMFTNEEALCLGNVRDEHLFESEKFLKGLEKLREFSDKTNNPECRDCFIRTLCNGCLGMNASHDGNEFHMNQEVCEMFRKMTERAIIQYVNNNLMVEKEDEPQKT